MTTFDLYGNNLFWPSRIRSKKVQQIQNLRDAQQQISITPALAQGYRLALCDDTVTFPFQLTPELLHRAAILSRQPISQRPKAVFDYLYHKIEYGDSRRGNAKYSLSTEVWKQKQGVCGEMAYLYVSMARFAGLVSSYVQVSKDTAGKKVNHACASVQTNVFSPIVCADIAYRVFDVKHVEWKPLTDEKAWELFKSWR